MTRVFSYFLVFLSFTLYAATQGELQTLYDDIVVKSPETKIALTKAERKELLKLTYTNKVAKLSAIDTYDHTPNKEIGFCYGRAMAAHLIARQMGLAERSILKLFVAGDMTSGPVRWRFHVTTLVRGVEDGNWYTIDPIMPTHADPDDQPGDPELPHALLPRQWMKIVKRKFDPANKAKFYITTTDSIMVDMREVPATLTDENGNRIIEVGFNPDRPGIEKEREIGELGGFDVYRVDSDAQEKYFTKRREGKAADEFDFLGLDIVILRNGQKTPRNYKYNGYFPDLFKSLGTVVPD